MWTQVQGEPSIDIVDWSVARNPCSLVSNVLTVPSRRVPFSFLIRFWCEPMLIVPNKLYNCETCGRRYKENLYRHRRLECGKEPMFPYKMYNCETCGRRYKYKENLYRHRRLECGKEPMFPCQQCPYRAKQKSRVTPNKCGRCGRQYKYKDNLLRHQRYECGQEPRFCCPHCPYKAKQKSNLQTHMMNKHNV
ncbi:zinc finger protein 626-like [Homalodisca vitripennis]|uniref:zinc finger protein 626-like n=1 Tax=Homalodisca vitripennis TaxID=197043 RepID=UPI001EEB5E9C|nr:zinc finger protein 626-like [Homalodisca vitripennis]